MQNGKYYFLPDCKIDLVSQLPIDLKAFAEKTLHQMYPSCK